MEDWKFVDADGNKIRQDWYICTLLKGREGDLVYFREIYQTGNSWVVEAPSGEFFLNEYEVSVYRRVLDIKAHLEKQSHNLDWAKSRLEQLAQPEELIPAKPTEQDDEQGGLRRQMHGH